MVILVTSSQRQTLITAHLDPAMCNIAVQHNRTSAAGLESQRRCRIALQCSQIHSSHDYLLFLRYENDPCELPTGWILDGRSEAVGTPGCLSVMHQANLSLPKVLTIKAFHRRLL